MFNRRQRDTIIYGRNRKLRKNFNCVPVFNIRLQLKHACNLCKNKYSFLNHYKFRITDHSNDWINNELGTICIDFPTSVVWKIVNVKLIVAVQTILASNNNMHTVFYILSTFLLVSIYKRAPPCVHTQAFSHTHMQVDNPLYSIRELREEFFSKKSITQIKRINLLLTSENLIGFESG